MASHYQRLGVTPSASIAELRAAYRVLATRLHPDRHSAATPAERALAERRMREINEAWQTLRDPASRRRYDESLFSANPSAHPAASTRSPSPRWPVAVDADDDLIDVMGDMTPMQARLVRGLPWAALVAVLGLIFVFTAYATANKSTQSPPSTRVAVDVGVGSCLRITTGSTPPETSVVPCAQPNDGLVVSRVSQASDCPPGAEPRRLGVDGWLDCIAPVTGRPAPR